MVATRPRSRTAPRFRQAEPQRAEHALPGARRVKVVTVYESNLERGLPSHLATMFVETREAFAPTPVGCAELAGLDPDGATELGELLLGTAPGRTDAAGLTVYRAMGHVAQDIAAAELVYAAALREGAGVTVEF